MKGRFLRGADLALAALFVAVIGVNFVQVFARYVLATPLAWGEEFMRYAMIWIVMVAPVVLILEDDHIVAFEYTGERGVVLWLRVLCSLGVAVVGAVLVWKGIPVAERNLTQLAPASQLPMAVPYAALPVGGAIAIVASMIRVRQLLRHAR